MGLVKNLLSRDKVPVFILGCQRSGTTICQNVFMESRRFAVFREGSKKAMTENWRLRETSDIHMLIEKTRQRFILFKPINDSQWADQLLSEYENSLVIWIYRDVFDTSNSAVAKWQGSQRDMIKWIGDAFAGQSTRESALARIAEKPNYGIYAERLSEELQEQLACWTRSELSPHTGAAILWYLRNRIILDLGLETDPRVLLVRYEDFVQEPESQLKRMCSFMGARYSEKLAKGVFNTSVNKSETPLVNREVKKACEKLAGQLDAARLAQSLGIRSRKQGQD